MKQKQLLLIYFSLLITLSYAGYVPQWVVSVRSQHDANVVATENGLINKGKIGGFEDMYLYYYKAGELDVQYYKITESLKNHSKVNYVEQEKTLQHVLKDFSFPDDPYWEHQWPLYDKPDPGSDINVVPAWIEGVSGKNTYALIVDNGIQLNHPDLQDNIDTSLCYSTITGSNDISPIRRLSDPEYPYGHGTECAGVIAMIHDNDICGVGVAYHATIGGFQMDFDRKTPSDEANAFNFEYQIIQVSSNSWGPLDNGYTVEKPAYISNEALIEGVTNGRNGLGTIYVFSAGNGGNEADSCAADGYASSIYTIAIGSLDQDGNNPLYEEACSAKMAVAYSNSRPGNQVVSTWPESECVRNFTGTSAATPLVSGVILLALEVNPRLSWRDIQYLIAYTSNSDIGGSFQDNGGGLCYDEDNYNGFGVIDAISLVTRARYWTPVGPVTRNEYTVVNIPITVDGSNKFEESITVEQIGYLEHVVLQTTFSIILDSTSTGCLDASDYDESMVCTEDSGSACRGACRGAVSIKLCSPSGFCSTLLPERCNDFISCEGYTDWPFMSVAFWGAKPTGTWAVTMSYSDEISSSGGAQLTSMVLMLYTVQNRPEDVVDQCNEACDTLTGCSYGNGTRYCDTCGAGYYRNVTSQECVRSCSAGACVIEDTCVFYNGTCPITDLPTQDDLSERDIIFIIVGSGIGAFMIILAALLAFCCCCCRSGRSMKNKDRINLERSDSIQVPLVKN